MSPLSGKINRGSLLAAFPIFFFFFFSFFFFFFFFFYFFCSFLFLFLSFFFFFFFFLPPESLPPRSLNFLPFFEKPTVPSPDRLDPMRVEISPSLLYFYCLCAFSFSAWFRFFCGARMLSPRMPIDTVLRSSPADRPPPLVISSFPSPPFFFFFFFFCD